MRTCVGCRSTLPQSQMIRCALTPEGCAIISRTAPGRGAWLCSALCYPQAVKKRGFERAWRQALGPGALDTLAFTFESTTHDLKDLSTAGPGPAGATPMKG